MKSKTLPLREKAPFVTNLISGPKKIYPADLVSMNALAASSNIRVDLAYARDDNLLLGEAVYRPEAQLWLHSVLADIVIKAAELLAAQALRLILYDGLRTVEAQALMLKTRRVQDNPQWLEEPRLLSPPGAGAHPRGMAIDCSLETFDSRLLDMGTEFDFLSDDPAPAHNPAHREHPGLSIEATKNRAILDKAIMQATSALGAELLPLPQEWWDFRLPPNFYEIYAPLSDNDLPPVMRMCL